MIRIVYSKCVLVYIKMPLCWNKGILPHNYCIFVVTITNIRERLITCIYVFEHLYQAAMLVPWWRVLFLFTSGKVDRNKIKQTGHLLKEEACYNCNKYFAESTGYIVRKCCCLSNITSTILTIQIRFPVENCK